MLPSEDMGKLVTRIKASFTHAELNLKVGKSYFKLNAQDFDCFGLKENETPSRAHWLSDTFVVLVMNYLLTAQLNSELKDNVVLFDSMFACNPSESSKDTRHEEIKQKVSPFNRKRNNVTHSLPYAQPSHGTTSLFIYRW